jgi:RNA polymerase sigma-70 factor (ECF subfamily)
VKIIPLYASELLLIKACQAAEPKAQQVVYEKYAGKMYAICKRYIGAEMEAEDVMVEGFLKVFNKINGFEIKGSFEGWIKRIMVNESLMYLRSKKKEGFQVAYDSIIVEPTTNLPTTDLECDELMEMINSLSLGYKTVFNMYAIEGYSHSEIAKMLNISEGTSKSQLSRARALLQDIIQKKEMIELKNIKR